MKEAAVAYPGYVYLMPSLRHMYRYALLDEARKKDFIILCIPRKMESILEAVGKGMKSVVLKKFDAKVSTRYKCRKA